MIHRRITFRMMLKMLLCYAVIILVCHAFCRLACWMIDGAIPTFDGLIVACLVAIGSLFLMCAVFDEYLESEKPIKTSDMAEEKQTLRSGIIGQAQVIFGGGVQVSVGTVGNNKDTLAIGLSELIHPAEGPGKEAPSQETYCGTQVSLVFPNFDSIRNFREMLNELEYEMKSRIDEELKGESRTNG